MIALRLCRDRTPMRYESESTLDFEETLPKLYQDTPNGMYQEKWYPPSRQEQNQNLLGTVYFDGTSFLHFWWELSFFGTYVYKVPFL